MKTLLKILILVIASVLSSNVVFTQNAVPHETVDTGQASRQDSTWFIYARHKQLPSGYEKEALEALSHFPELKNVAIRFKLKKSFSTLKTRPGFFSAMMPRGHRSYTIIISNKTIQRLMPLMFSHLSYEARVGVIGHELSHVLYFSGKSTWQCFKVLIGHLSASYLDRFEYNTDMICIRHGLGKDLEAWSSYIRNTMHTAFWRGSDYVNKNNAGHERYMNPATIEKNIGATSDSTTHNN